MQFFLSRCGRVGCPQNILLRKQKFPTLFSLPTQEIFCTLPFHCFKPRTGEDMPETPGLQRTNLRLCPKALIKRCADLWECIQWFVFSCACLSAFVFFFSDMSHEFFSEASSFLRRNFFRCLANDVTRHSAAMIYIRV